jgi:hypothetical protein
MIILGRMNNPFKYGSNQSGTSMINEDFYRRRLNKSNFDITYPRRVSVDMQFKPHSRISIVNGILQHDPIVKHLRSYDNLKSANVQTPPVFDVNSFFV